MDGIEKAWNFISRNASGIDSRQMPVRYLDFFAEEGYDMHYRISDMLLILVFRQNCLAIYRPPNSEQLIF